MNYYTNVLKKYAVFTGRAGRKEFWMFVLINSIIAFALYGLGMAIDTQVLYYLYALAVFIPGIAVGTRRLHDTDRSGWWQFIAFIPFVGGIILIVFFVQKGMSSANQYGSALDGAVAQPVAPAQAV